MFAMGSLDHMSAKDRAYLHVGHSQVLQLDKLS